MGRRMLLSSMQNVIIDYNWDVSVFVAGICGACIASSTTWSTQGQG